MESINKILAFDIWSDFAYFKKFYTTSSPLTYSIPTPTSIYGIIGAIIGKFPNEDNDNTNYYLKNKYLKYINSETSKVGVSIINPILKTRFATNWLDTKDKKFDGTEGRTQVKIEYIKNPKYRIYVNINDENLFNILIKRVKNNESYYTVSLGSAYLVADFEFIELFDNIEFLTKFHGELNSCILNDNIEQISFDENKKYMRETLPVSMNYHRDSEYKEIVFESNSNNIKGKFKNCYKLGNNQIISFIN